MGAPKEDIIDPKKLIEKYSIEELNYYSNEYYKQLVLPEYQLGKPFSMPTEAAQHLVRLGLILENFRIGPGSRVLDFGAGTCWLSKALWQMGCDVTAVDVSEKALQMGKELFEKYPVPMRKNGNWRLRLFDGHRLPLDDNSVDRIICYDTFHHVPNTKEVAAEFNRVLVDGGVIALNEPIGEHSTSEASQREMRDYNVLENDLEVDQLVQLFARHGLVNPRLKIVPTARFTVGMDDWKKAREGETVPVLARAISEFTQNCIILYFQKGDTRLDSRSNEGLSHTLEADQVRLESKVNEPVWIKLKIRNTGTATWLHGTGTTTGVVNIGTQRIDPNTKSFIAEHARFHFDHDIQPGEEIEMTVPIMFDQLGSHTIRLDLVSELVCWFHDLGSKPIYLSAIIHD